VAVTQATEQQAVGEATELQTTAGECAAFDAAVSEFLAYLEGYRQPALSVVERVLTVDGRGVPH